MSCFMNKDEGINYYDLSYMHGREDGLLWVDTSALYHVGPFSVSGRESLLAQIKKVGVCLGYLRKRKNVATTIGVLREIRDGVDYYKSKRKAVRGVINYCRKQAGAPLLGLLRENLRNDKVALSTLRRIGGFLERQTEENFLDGMSGLEFSVMCGDINVALVKGEIFSRSHRYLYLFLERGAVRRYSKLDFEFLGICDIWARLVSWDDTFKLSVTDKELLTASIYSGSGNGLFSADIPMILAYRNAVEFYSLNDCFVCDSAGSSMHCLD